MKASRKIEDASHVVTAEYATRNLLADLAANQRYIVTHDNYRDEFMERSDDVLKAIERAQT